jgi:hypothetical protein
MEGIALSNVVSISAVGGSAAIFEGWMTMDTIEELCGDVVCSYF